MSNGNANFTPIFKGYTGQQPFRYWCQTVLPLVYDDSLSYYELLNKVVVYLNNVISDVSNVEDNVQSLYNAYEQLQGYVNTYFDNLDVQSEINHKLDEMAEDGTLSDLISPYVSELIGGVVEEQIGDTVAEQIGGAVASQINAVVAEQIGTPASTATTAWLNANVNPVGSAVMVDASLTISGAAADAKVVGDNFKQNKYEMNSVPYTGNLANLSQGNYNINGITVEIHKNKMTINGTATQAVALQISDISSRLPIGSNYVSYWNITGTKSGTDFLYAIYEDNTYSSGGNIGTNHQINITKNNYYLRFYCQAGCTYDNYSFDLMITTGTTVPSSFEEYGEYPKMNPFALNNEFMETKNEVVQTAYKYNMAAVSANLAFLNQGTFNNNGITISVHKNTVTINGTSTGISVIPLSPINSSLTNGTYIYTAWNVDGSTDGGGRIYGVYENSEQTLISSTSNDLSEKHATSITNPCYLKFACANGVTFNNYTFTIMITKGTMPPTAYSEYGEAPKINTFINDACNKMTGFNCFTKYAIIGDSLSLGAQSRAGGGFMSKKTEHSWGKTVEKIFGTPCYWTGKSGETTKTWLEQTDEGSTWGLKYAQEIGVMPLYFVCMGANESDITIGSINDINDNNPTTLYGYVGKLIRELRNISPECYIIMIGVSRAQSNAEIINAVYENTASEFAKCYYYDVQSMLRNEMFMNLMIGAHYTAIGYSKMGIYYNYVVSQIINDNLSDFNYLTEID